MIMDKKKVESMTTKSQESPARQMLRGSLNFPATPVSRTVAKIPMKMTTNMAKRQGNKKK